MPDRPVIRLKPKADVRALRHGAPWAFIDDVVMDRRTKAVRPGTIVRLEDTDRRAIGTFAFNPDAKLALRALDPDPEAAIDAGWLAARVDAASKLRKQLYSTPHYRLVHAEGDGLSGLIIDRMDDVAVVQPNAAWVEARLDDLLVTLADLGMGRVVKSTAGRARALEGLPDDGGVIAGNVGGPIDVPMNGAIYRADPLGGQKTGLFFDQRANHAFVAALAKGRRVLDVFSHVGGFALAALAEGAASALAVDGSEPALTLAHEGARRTGVADRLETRRADAFEALAALGADGRRFDTVVCDPPAFATSRKALGPGLRAYERIARLAAPLVEPGGTLTLCSCSQAAELTKFHAACARGIGRAGRQAALLRTGFAGPDHPVHPALGGPGYLKVLTFRLA